MLNFLFVVPTKSIEKTYQRTSSVDHIIERPDSYIGSVEKETKVIFFTYFKDFIELIII